MSKSTLMMPTDFPTYEVHRETILDKILYVVGSSDIPL
jgi:hypothetical protein